MTLEMCHCPSYNSFVCQNRRTIPVLNNSSFQQCSKIYYLIIMAICLNSHRTVHTDYTMQRIIMVVPQILEWHLTTHMVLYLSGIGRIPIPWHISSTTEFSRKSNFVHLPKHLTKLKVVVLCLISTTVFLFSRLTIAALNAKVQSNKTRFFYFLLHHHDRQEY